MKSVIYLAAKLQARMDARCTSGNKPCGKRCIPNQHECGGNDDDKLHKQNGNFLYDAYGFEEASHSMARQNPRMSLAKAKSYHKDMAYAIAKNDNPNRDMAAVNRKYQHYFEQ